MTTKRIAAAVVLLAALLAAAVTGLNHLDEGAPPGPAARADAAQLQRGEYLARVGHCAGCHTARGGPAWAGGGAIATPFGTVYSANLTPDESTGLGRWTAADFWRALHNGRSADGRLLAPACPYPNFSQVSHGDVADLFAYLRSQPPARLANRPHQLRFPYGTQAALAVWRALYFRPGPARPEPGRSAEWQRGAYLVAGLGHCGACHGSRNAWGATDGALDLRGGEVPMQGWLAPALDDPHAAGVAGWPPEQVVALLKTGVNDRAGVSGPMAMVVARSTQFMAEADLRAIAVYLQSLPAPPAAPQAAAAPLPPAQAALGAEVYDHHCAGCHGRDGEGAAGAVPALAGHRALAQASPVNLLKVVLLGAFAPATAGNPRPYGMPPFATQLSDDEVAAVASWLRQRWGGGARPVSAREVNQARGG